MFKTRAEEFYRDLKPRTRPSGFGPDKTSGASFLNGFQKHTWNSLCQEHS